jgi:glycosyltransferase involved in cell wall biosynthesis
VQERPRVSVCIPVYNGERFLAETIRSVLDQTYRDFELVVLDNASTDATGRIARSFGDPRVRVETNPSTIVQPENWRAAVRLCRAPRQQGVRREVRYRDQVGVAGLLTDGADGVAGETDALVLQLLDGLDRHQLRAWLAGQVDEQGQQEPDTVRAGPGGQVEVGHRRRRRGCGRSSGDVERHVELPRFSRKYHAVRPSINTRNLSRVTPA